MKKLIPAIVMLIVSAVVLSTASYAWFTVGTDVQATGMSVKATAPSSILIAGELADGELSEYSHTVTFDQGTAILSPVSSWNGVNFFAPGACQDTQGAATYGTTFGTVNQQEGNWMEYTIWLKNDAAATVEGEGGADVASESIHVALASITTTSAKTIKNAVRISFTTDVGTYVYDIDEATHTWVRVAVEDGVYDEDGDGVADSPAVGPIYMEGTADNFDTVAVGAEKTLANTKTDSADAPTAIITLAPQVAKSITVRIWFEGQDSTCIAANGGYSVPLEFAFTKVDAAPVAPATEPTP